MGLDRPRASLSVYRKFSRDLVTKRAGQGYKTDAEFYDHDGQIFLQIEAKAEGRRVRRLADEIRRAGELAELPTGFVKELEYVLDLAPR